MIVSVAESLEYAPETSSYLLDTEEVRKVYPGLADQLESEEIAADYENTDRSNFHEHKKFFVEPPAKVERSVELFFE